MRRAVVAVLLAVASTAGAQAPEEAFPVPASLRPAVDFWTRVYTEVDTKGGFIHDSTHLGIVYHKVTFPNEPTARQRRREIQRLTEHYRDILTRLGGGSRSGLSTDEARVLALWPADVSDEELRNAARRLRFQLGQADRFRAGLQRSGQWLPFIKEVLAERGLPEELAVLPHVESSFDPTAYSKVGAAGMWQFTRSTGLRYMQIDHIIDERRDPFLSTFAAVRLLEDNYSVIQSWPLAITAYNHGLAGMRRAASVHNTRDIGVIVADYRGRTFGFASRNFYAAFLAALEVDTNAERYFGNLRRNPAADTSTIEVPDYMAAGALASALGLSIAELKLLNPALMDTVWAGDKYVPRSFALRLPANVLARADAALAGVPAGERFAAQQPDEYHRVRRGDTLSGIATQYRISVAALVRANGLQSRNFIREGQVLTLPISGSRSSATDPASVATAINSDEYMVRRGDSVAQIARRLGVSEQQLLAVNSIRNKNRIFPGQILKVPGAAASGAVETVLVSSEPASREAIVTAAIAPPVAAATEPSPAAASQPIAAVVASARAPVGPIGAVADAAPAIAGSVVIQPVVAVAQEAPPIAQPVVAVAEPSASTAPSFAAAAEATSEIEIEADAELDAELLQHPAEAALADTELDPSALESEQARLAADPSDYSIADDQSIEVQALETLGHYADWLQIRTQRLRDINGLAFREAVVVGQRIKLDMSNVDAELFEQRRLAYQERVQESFFSAYQITEIQDHVIRAGESLWLLAQRTYNVPVWLLRQYNPDLDLDRIHPGTIVKFPRLQRIGGANQVSTNGDLG